MLGKIYELHFFSIYQFCRHKAWFASDSYSFWAVLLYSLLIHFLISGIVLILGSVYSLDVKFIVDGGRLGDILPSFFASSLVFWVALCINYLYFVYFGHWKEVVEKYSCLSSGVLRRVYVVCSCSIFLMFLFRFVGLLVNPYR